MFHKLSTVQKFRYIIIDETWGKLHHHFFLHYTDLFWQSYQNFVWSVFRFSISLGNKLKIMQYSKVTNFRTVLNFVLSYFWKKVQNLIPYENLFLSWGHRISMLFCFEALESTKIISYEPVSSQKYENGYRTKICYFTVSVLTFIWSLKRVWVCYWRQLWNHCNKPSSTSGYMPTAYEHCGCPNFHFTRPLHTSIFLCFKAIKCKRATVCLRCKLHLLWLWFIGSFPVSGSPRYSLQPFLRCRK